MQGLLVTGTDTGVGKTVLSAALLAAVAAAGHPVAAHKPAVTGLDEPSHDGAAPPLWPADHELLGAAAGMAPEEVAPLRFGPAVSPALAAELAGEPLARGRVLDAARAALAAASAGHARDDCAGEDCMGEGGMSEDSTSEGGAAKTLIVEGAGGLLSPLADELTVCDLAVALRLPLLIAARPGLGTINHTLLTLQSARAAGLNVRAVVLTPWPAQPARLERSNRDAIARFGFVEVAVLPRAAGPDLAELVRIGEQLPWRRWLGRPSTQPAPARAAATSAPLTRASSSGSITYGGIA